MFRLALKNLRARRFRLVTTGIAVLLGVAFLSGVLVLSDTFTSTFDNLFSNVFKGTDAYVRAVEPFKGPREGSREARPSVDASVLPKVRAVPEVADAEADVNGYAQVVGKNGKAVGKLDRGPPTLGVNWKHNPALNAYHLVSGRGPQRSGEVALDAHSAKVGKYRVGDEVRLLTKSGPTTAHLVGIAKFGKYDSAAGSTSVFFTLADAQRWVGDAGQYRGIAVVAKEGVSQDAVRSAITKALPRGTEAITGAALTKESQDQVASFLNVFKTVLVVFALIALFVCSFIIYNTFSILVAQRVRENALLRAIGASRRQVMAALVAEALGIGLIASVLGAVVGLALASGLKTLLHGLGVPLPANGLAVRPSALIIGIGAGTVVSVAAGWFPARRGGRVPPIAAMRDVALDGNGRPRLRLAIGGGILLLGLVSLFNGLSGGDGALVRVGVGAVAILCGVAALGPIAAEPLTRVLGAPIARWRGVSGVLARENAMRNPRRTATTASALLIGVSLVSFMTIFAASAKASLTDTLNKQFTGDFVLNTNSFGLTGVSTNLDAELRRLPQLSAVSPVRNAIAQFNGKGVLLQAMDARSIGAIADFGVEKGKLTDLDARSVAVSEKKAKSEHWTLGSTVKVVFPKTGTQSLTVRVIYKNRDLASSYWVDTSVFDANVATQFDSLVLAKVASDSSIAKARPAVERITKQYPNVDVQDRQQFIDNQAKNVNQLLGLVFVMLFLSLVIALFGIANTLALSVVERTREIGLVRAVGMTRRQVRSAVRWEAVLIALFGAVGGLAVGVFFGWALIHALADQGFHTFRVSFGWLVGIAVASGVFAVIAAIVPARRAARLNVLAAIATE